MEVQPDEADPLHHPQDVAAQGPSLAEAGVLLILKTNQQSVRAVTLVEVRKLGYLTWKYETFSLVTPPHLNTSSQADTE